MAISIIGILLAIIIPAVQRSREAARRVECTNHLKQVGLAVTNYHDLHGQFPINYGAGVYNDNNRGVSWLTMILPQLDQATLYSTINFGEPLTDDGNSYASKLVVPTFLCASDLHDLGVMPNRRETHEPRAITNYKACLGSNWAWGSFAPVTSKTGKNAGETDGLDLCNGVICRGGSQPPSGNRMRDITDGASHTFLLGEAVPEWCLYTWWYWYNASTATCAVPLNYWQIPEDTDDDWFYSYSFASRHPNGANFCLADGSVHFVGNQIDQKIYRGAATIQGDEVLGEF